MKVKVKPMSKIGDAYYQQAEIHFDNSVSTSSVYDAMYDILGEIDYNIPFFYNRDENVLYMESCHMSLPEECSADLNRLVKDFADKYKEFVAKGIPEDFLKEREYEL